jgi:uncharacterized protein involved in exopolysaccharide biosynthesis
MPDVAIVRSPGTAAEGDELSLWALAIVLLRHRVLIGVLALLGGVLAFVFARSKPMVYASSATFIPQATQSSMSGIAMLAASQFGVSMPSSNAGNWGPPTYLELLRSRELLDPIADDTVVVAERGNRAIPVLDLLQVKAPTQALRVEAAVGQLRGMIVASEAKTLGGVKLRISTPWPSVSLWLTNRVLRGVNQFNIQTRKSQSVEELQFVTAQAVEADRALAVAENRLQNFLQGNREFVSPQLTFERDRLQREVSLRRELQMSWLKNREDARVRAVRENPVITVFESPRLALHPESRHAVRSAVLGFIVGGTIAVLLAFLSHLLTAARRANGADARYFFDLMEQSKPRFLRRAAR